MSAVLKLEQALRAESAIVEARKLVDLYGEEDPRAFLAIVKAVNLADPGFMDKTLEECGLGLPKPDFVDDEGNPVWTTMAIADAAGVPHEQLMANLVPLIDGGLLSPIESTHRIQ